MHTPLRRGESIAAEKRQPPNDEPAAEAAPNANGARRLASDEDARLMLAFQAGDESAFATIVERNQARIYGVVHRFCAGREDIEDIVQEVFLRVFRSADRYEPTARFSTWLYRIAANLSMSALRSAGRSRVVRFPTGDGEDARAEVPDTDTATPEEDLQSKELAEQVRAAIAKLPENQRIAIVLRRYENMSYDQISDVMELSVMAVKSLLNRARGNLRTSLARHVS